MRFKRKNKKIGFEIYLWFAILILALFCPYSVSWGYCALCFVVFLIYCYYFFKKKHKKNYFDFCTIFLMCLGITGYVYPLFIYENISNPFLPFFLNTFDLRAIPKATLCTTISACLFMRGSLSKSYKYHNIKKKNFVNSKYIIYILIFCSFIFFIIGGFDFYKNHYSGEETQGSSLIYQLETIIQCLTMWITANEFYQIYYKKKKYPDKFYSITIIVVAVIFAVSGNRTSAMIILLPFLYYCCDNYYKISLYKFMVLIPVAFVLMFAVQVIRSGDSFSLANVSFDNAVSDLIIPSRSNYLVYECIDKNGYSFGTTMLGSIVSVIPSLNSKLSSLGFDVNALGSAVYFTSYTDKTGGYALTGLGTTLQADVQLAFGYVGLIIFYFLGKFEKISYKNMRRGNKSYFIIYSVFVSMSVFWIRAELTYPVRLFVWTLILDKVITYILKKKHGKNRILHAEA